MKAALVAELPVQAMILVTHLFRARYDTSVGGCNTQGVVIDGHISSALTLDALYLHVGNVPHLQAALFAFDFEGHRRILNTQYFSYMRCQHGWVPARLTRKDFRQRSTLRFIGFVIQVERNFPRHLSHMAGRVHCKGNVHTVQFHVIENSVVNVPSNKCCAFPVCGRTKEQARTGRLAIARLEIASFQISVCICHDQSPTCQRDNAPNGVVNMSQNGERHGLTNATCVFRLHLILQSVALGSHQSGVMQRLC